jgi:hypothetical protein
MLKYFGCLAQLIISPRKGWVDIAARGESPQTIASVGFYRLLGITACSAFIPWLYNHQLTLPVLIESAVVTFVTFFISYFLATVLLTAGIERVSDDNPGEKKISTFALYSISILALIALLRNCIPMDLSLVQFMPLLVLVVMWAGRAYLNVREESTPTFLLICGVCVIVPPYLIDYLFHLLMPA